MPTKNRKKQSWSLLIILFLVFSLFSTKTIQAQNNNDPIGDRANLDAEQTQMEADKLDELQQSDLEQCSAETSGGNNTTGATGGGTNTGTGGSTGGATINDEQEARAALAQAGYQVNNINACGGLTYAEYSRQNNGQRCTSVAGLPQHSIDQLDELHEVVGSSYPFTITGGTEDGHATHGVGQNIVDLDDNNSQLNSYIASHAVSSWQGSRGIYYQHANGDVYLRESDHWHVNFSGSDTGNSQTAFKQPTIWEQIKMVWWPVAQAIQLVSSSNDTSRMIDGMSDLDLNLFFNGSSASNINNVITKLPFDTLNRTINRLDDNALENLMSSLTNNSYTSIAHQLTSESLDHIFDNLKPSTIRSVVNDLDNSNLSSIFSNLDPDSLDNVFSHLTSSASNNLIGQLNQGALSNVFNGVNSNLIDNIVGGLGQSSLNRVFTLLGGSTLNQVLGGLDGGVMDNVLPLLGATGLTNIFSNGLPDVVNEALQEVSPEILTQVTEALPDNVLQEATAKIPVINELMGGDGVLSEVAGLGSGLYVPVVEQNGQLMEHTAKIDSTTQEVRDLSIQICTYLKAIKRIQARAELASVEDADVMRIRATEIEKYRQALLDLINKGYTDNEGNKDSGPLFITNTRLYWEENALEGINLARVVIASSTNPHKNDILNDLTQGAELSINPTITQEQIDLLQNTNAQTNANQGLARSLNNIPILSSLIIKPIKKTLAILTGRSTLAQVSTTNEENQSDDEAWWEAWKLLIQPRNNRYGSYLIASDLINTKKNEAVAIARDEAIAGQGFLPIRECVEWASENPKVCRVWQTKTPGSLIKDSGSAGLNARLDQYIQAKKKGELVQGNEPNVSEIITLTPSTGGGGAPGSGLITPDQIPESSQDLRSDSGSNSSGSTNGGNNNNNNGTGTNNNDDSEGFDWGSIVSFVDNLFRSDDTPEESNYLLLQALLGLFNQQAPLVHFNFANRGDNEVLLYWFSPNANSCVASNDWLEGEEVIKETGVSLGKSNRIRINKPNSGFVNYQITCVNNQGEVAKEIIISSSE